MKINRISLVSMCVLASAISQAITFSNSVYTSTLPGASAVTSQSGNSFFLNLTAMDIPNGAFEDLTWSFDYASAVPLVSTTLRIRGLITTEIEPGTGAVVATEEVFDTSGSSAVNIASGYMVDSAVATNDPVSFVWEETFMFSQGSTVGSVTKDMLFGYQGGGNLEVYSIEQEFRAVPEPATMVAISFGIAAIQRRRRK